MKPLFFIQTEESVVEAVENTEVVEAVEESASAQPSVTESIDAVLNYDWSHIKDVLVDGALVGLEDYRSTCHLLCRSLDYPPHLEVYG